jgi:hypothetical protein
MHCNYFSHQDLIIPELKEHGIAKNICLKNYLFTIFINGL